MAEESKQGWAGLFLSNSTFFISALYSFATAVGLIYSWVLYGRFGINIFDYSEIADFLLAAFKNPIAFGSAGLLGAIGSVLFLYRASASGTRRQMLYKDEMGRLEETTMEKELLEQEVSMKQSEEEWRQVD